MLKSSTALFLFQGVLSKMARRFGRNVTMEEIDTVRTTFLFADLAKS